MKTARINEIFYSYQGEGPYQGEPQVFVRFSGCNMNCIYCDTEHYSRMIFNVNDLLKEVLNISLNIHSVAITGGEPLCQTEFLAEFLPKLKKKGIKIYLETNGILDKELERIMPYVDIIAMDFKLPSSTRRKAFWREHEDFLKAALSREVFVKVVVSSKTTKEDWFKAVDMISKLDPELLLVLQPVTTVGNSKRPSGSKIAIFKNLALEKLDKVEVISQVHPLLGVK